MKASRDNVAFFISRAFSEYWETARENDDRFETRTASEFVKDFGLFLQEADDLTQPPTYAGLGRSDLRSPSATTPMTAAEFEYLKAHPGEVPPHMQAIYYRTLHGETRSIAARKAVQTKRKKFTTWPTKRRSHTLKGK